MRPFARSSRSIRRLAIPLLAKARPLIAGIDDPLAKEKLAELDETLALCAGLWVEAQAQKPEVAPGEDLNVTVTVLNRSAADVAFEGARVEGIWNETLPAKPAKLGNNQSATVEFTRRVPQAQPYSQPYWLEKPPSGDVYTVDDQMLIGQPDTPPAAQVRLRLTIGGAPVELVRPVHYRYAERAEGERHRAVVVVPAVAVELPEAVALFPASAPRQVEVAVVANEPNASGDLRLELPAGWKAEPASQAFHVTAAGEESAMTFQVTPPAGETTATLRAVATVHGRAIGSGMKVISYPHIPVQVLFPPAAVKLVRTNVKVTAHKVGYIAGPGDEMPDALRQLGLDVTPLTQSDLEHGDLSRFDAIVAGVRAYNVRADLRANQPRLMEYVRQRRDVHRAVSNRRWAGSRCAAGGRPGRESPGDSGCESHHVKYGAVSFYSAGGKQIPCHGGRFAGGLSAYRQPAVAVSQSHHGEGFRRLGAGARRVLRGEVGSALRNGALHARSGRTGVAGRRTLYALWQGRLHLHRVRLVPATACRCGGSVPAICEYAEREVTGRAALLRWHANRNCGGRAGMRLARSGRGARDRSTV